MEGVQAVTGPLFIEAWGRAGVLGGSQEVRQHCVKMLQGSKSGSHSC